MQIKSRAAEIPNEIRVFSGAEAVETALLVRKWAYMRKSVLEAKAVLRATSTHHHGQLGVRPYLEGVGPTFVDGRALELKWENIAAFLAEHIQGEARTYQDREGYLSKVHALCKKHNVLLSCDEIQTGLCRTDKMLACEYDAVRPDMVLLGKALSGGVYPVSAVLADRDFMLCIKHRSMYGGNPLGCAVALTALHALLDEQRSPRAPSPSTRSSATPSSRCASPLVAGVRGRGLLNAVVIDEAKSARGHAPWQLCLLSKSPGVLPKPTHVNILRFAPPLVISEEDVLRAVKIIGECLVDLEQREELSGEVESERGHTDLVTS
ncbi:pyridoxal phosphate-dependent transferase [Mycena vitilis]|nr:pyridoxal phosphate-dependent transferase [Mycena vitilis]